MNLDSTRSGSMMLLVVVLMSMLLVLCTRMWRSTAYVIDIAIQKQVYMQKKSAVRGVLNCGVQACRTDYQALHAYVTEHGGTVTVPVNSYVVNVPLVSDYTPVVTYKVVDEAALYVTGELLDGKKALVTISCVVKKPMLSHNAPL